MPVKHLARTTLLLAALASVVEGCSLGFGDDLSGEGTPSDGRGGKSGASGSSGRAGAAGTSGVSGTRQVA